MTAYLTLRPPNLFPDDEWCLQTVLNTHLPFLELLLVLYLVTAMRKELIVCAML